jgi:hypothetical protein
LFNNLKKDKMKYSNYKKLVDSFLYIIIAGLFSLAMIAIASLYWGVIAGKIKDVFF